MLRIICETCQIGDVPVTTLGCENLTHAPMVLFMHGLWGDKRQCIELGHLLAAAGFFFVAPDAYMHGDRLDPVLAETGSPGQGVYPPDSGLDMLFLMFRIIDRTAADAVALLDHFCGDPRVDSRRIGIGGYSMGGFTAFRVAAIDARITALAAINGIPAFGRRWRDIIDETSTYERWAGPLAALAEETARRTAFIDSIDPLDSLGRFAPKPLLLVNGDRDTDCPKHYALDLYRALEPLYAEGRSDLRLVVPDADHRLTRAMFATVSQWFENRLHG